MGGTKTYDWGLDERWLWFVPIDIEIQSGRCTDGGEVKVHETGIFVEIVGSFFELLCGARSCVGAERLEIVDGVEGLVNAGMCSRVHGGGAKERDDDEFVFFYLYDATVSRDLVTAGELWCHYRRKVCCLALIRLRCRLRGVAASKTRL
jgi:hypothetical protein